MGWASFVLYSMAGACDFGVQDYFEVFYRGRPGDVVSGDLDLVCEYFISLDVKMYCLCFCRIYF